MSEEERRARNAAYARKHYAANKDKLQAKARSYYAANKDKMAEKERKKQLKKYGITPDQFEGMLTAQNSKCAICGTTEPKGMGNFHTDHCHSTGQVRGLLCYHCNVGLGHFRDDEALLMSAKEYLHAARTP